MYSNIRIYHEKFLGFHIVNTFYNDPSSFEAKNGTGISQYIIPAIIKSYVEAIERVSVSNSKINNTNGCAAGFFTTSTKRRALLELIERDAFFWHFRNKIPFNFFSEDEKTKTYILQTVNSKVFTFCTIPKEDYACVAFGLGASFNKCQAIEKSKTECLTQMVTHHSKPDYCLKIIKNLNSKVSINFFHSPHRHHLLSTNKTIKSRWNYLTMKRNNKAILRNQINLSTFTYNKIKSPNFFVKVYRCEHPKLIKLEFDIPEKWSKEKVYHPLN